MSEDAISRLPSARVGRRIAAAAVLVLAAAATIATSQNAFNGQSTEQGVPFVLDEDAPRYSQHFSLHVVPDVTNDNKVESLDYQFLITATVALAAAEDADSGDSAEPPLPPDAATLRISILADDDYTLVPQPHEVAVTAEPQRVIRQGDWHTCWHDADCTVGYTAVFEWIDGAPIEGEWEVTLAVTAGTNSDGFVTNQTVLDVTFDNE